jgi:TPR repeat protein
MSSPSTTAERPATPGGTKPNPIAALTPGRNGMSGEPVVDLPVLIEPVAEPGTGHRPPRRRFLATPVTPTTQIAAPAQLELLEIPRVVEPEPAPPAAAAFAALSAPAVQRPEAPPAEQPQRRSATWRLLRPAAARASVWLAHQAAMVRERLPANQSARFAVIAAAGVAALGLVALLGDLSGIGPFARVRHYPVSAAPSDPAKRFGYFYEGAQAGDAEAELQLAILYAKGEGVAQDYGTAATWFRAAANQGQPRAQYDMGVLTERGRGVKVDLTAAADWYLKAAQGGYPLAQYNLAVCYTKGQGVRQDLPEAALWYRRAATQGVVQAMVNLATMYEKGDGVAVSPVDAYAWYLAAGQRDNQTAARRAEDLYAGLPHLDQIRAEALASDVAASIHDPERGDNADALGAANR